ncbi:DUF732 domain-containing protein [Mycobacterium sp. M1]|uniref:DUF732 domain-containing protein n=1 Tax=Mycolicibacter acidiphilus TaxID=2835306 RepID=A0ABS5RDF8_9MYCO|nr:DUF732 domain-containing protein [Mycolicibacter acidiphilus]MBS9532316.1 DUF732 domain-containing protein [Mycolicibacter acidiphilus]
MWLRVGLLASALLLGVAGFARADPDQDQRFLTMLDVQRPAGQNVPELIDTAHRVCEKLDGGMSFDDVRSRMVNNANRPGTAGRQPPGDIGSLAGRFITAAVLAYCPQNQGKLP